MHALIDLDDAPASKSTSKALNRPPSTNQRLNTRGITNATRDHDAIDLTSRGLLAWWTFEDGVGTDKVTDVTDNRFKTPILREVDDFINPPPDLPPSVRSSNPTSELLPLRQVPVPASTMPAKNESFTESIATLFRFGWSWVDASRLPVRAALARKEGAHLNESTKAQSKGINDEEDSLLPVPSFIMRNLCPFEVRRFRLAARGRDLQRVVDCPLGKKYLQIQKRLASHIDMFTFCFVYDPLPRSVRPGCNETIRRIELRFHVHFECCRRRVKCRFDYCKATFPLQDRERHEEYLCISVSQRLKILKQVIMRNVY
jgi:hypothetical protein